MGMEARKEVTNLTKQFTKSYFDEELKDGLATAFQVASQFRYKQSFDSMVDAKDKVEKGLFEPGDVIIVGQDAYVFVNGKFELISRADSVSNAQNDNVELTEQKCKSCGAPLMISKYSMPIRCEYCGSVYQLD